MKLVRRRRRSISVLGRTDRGLVMERVPLPLASPSRNSGKVLSSRSSRIPVKIRKTSLEENKKEPLTKGKDIQDKCIPLPFVSRPKVVNSEDFVLPTDLIGPLAMTLSNKRMDIAPVVPLPPPESNFSLPKNRVKSSSSSSPVASQANLMKRKLEEDTKATFPMHELPNESCSQERINAWVDYSRASPCKSPSNDVIKEFNGNIFQAQQSPTGPTNCAVLLPQEDSMSIVHKSGGVSYSENDMDMDGTIPKLVEEPEELTPFSKQSDPEKLNPTISNSPPIEISPSAKGPSKSISDCPGKPTSPLPLGIQTISKVITQPEIESSTHSVNNPSGYGSSSASSVPSRPFQQQRIPTFVMNPSQGPSSTRRVLATVPSVAASSLCGKENLNSRVTRRTKSYSKTRNTPGYEAWFYRQKAFIAHGPAAIRSNDREAIAYSPQKFIRHHQPNFVAQQHAAFTKVITETFTEYEVQDKRNGNHNKNSHRSRRRDGSFTKKSRGRSLKKISKVSKIPQVVIVEEFAKPEEGQVGLKANLPIQNENVGIVLEPISQNVLAIVGQPSNLETIVEEPVEILNKSSVPVVSEEVENEGYWRERSRSTTKVSMVRQWSSPELAVQTENKESSLIGNQESATPTAVLSRTDSNLEQYDRIIPTLILAGHGNPYLEIPTQINPARESTPKKEDKLDFAYRKCASYKRLLKDSENTIRYLHQLLAIKEKKLEEAKSKPESVSGGDGISSKQSSKVKVGEDESTPHEGVRQINPLVLKQQNEEKGGSAIPKFDMDEFIRKWYRKMLSQDGDDTNNNRNSSFFQQSQLFRLSIAARAATCEDLRYQLNNVNHILRHKYDKLQAKIASKDPDSDAACIRLLDAYRRFVRYAYHYFDESLKRVENFDEMYMSQQFQDDKKRKLLYFHETTLNVGGESYYVVFLPIRVDAL